MSLCPNPCHYYDQDGVICNEEPWNCPIIQSKPENSEDPVRAITLSKSHEAMKPRGREPTTETE